MIFLNLSIFAVVKADDLEDSRVTRTISGGLDLTFGKMRNDTADRVNRYIKESNEFSQLCSDWRWYVIQEDRKRNDDDKPDKLIDSTKLLKWIQKLVAPAPITQDMKQSKSNTSKMQEHENEGGAPPGCGACLSKWFQSSRKSHEGGKNESKGDEIKSKALFLLGYSKDIEIEVEEGGNVEVHKVQENEKQVKVTNHLPRFEIKFSSESKKISKERYQGLYSWPGKGGNIPDLYLGEFLDGANFDSIFSLPTLITH